MMAFNFCGRPEGACRRARNTSLFAAKIGYAEQNFICPFNLCGFYYKKADDNPLLFLIKKW
jgi:hypothetical protein